MAVRAALTFDAEHPDRPAEPGMTERLLALLGEAGIRATFFIQGRWAEAYPALTRAIADGGHLVGNHSHYHARMSLLTDAGIASDLESAELAIRAATGVDPRPWFRCPFGDGLGDPRVEAGIAAAGYRHVGWHVDPEDWNDAVTARDIERDVFDGIERVGDGTVVLLHAWPARTVAAAESIVARAAAAGIALVRIDELSAEPVVAVPW